MRTRAGLLTIVLCLAFATAGLASIEHPFSARPLLVHGRAAGTREWGFSPALSRDGTTAVVGVESRDDHAEAIVLRRVGTAWHRQAVLIPRAKDDDELFQTQAALSSSGNVAVITGYIPVPDTGTGDDVIAAWVFVRIHGVWKQQGPTLRGRDEFSGDISFPAVAVSGDGRTVLLGNNGGGPDLDGEAYVFTRIAGRWAERATLSPNQINDFTGLGPSFGEGVALSYDGTTALVGGPDDGELEGAAWVFVRRHGHWLHQGRKLTAHGSDIGGYGQNVALSRDGSTAVVGGFHSDDLDGAVWAYHRRHGTWSQLGHKITGTDRSAPSAIGEAISLSDDGRTIAVGGPFDNTNVGGVWFFGLAGGEWHQLGHRHTLPGGHGFIRFGRGVALSGDGRIALAGAPNAHRGAGALVEYRR